MVVFYSGLYLRLLPFPRFNSLSLLQGRRRGAAATVATSADGDADLQMALAVSASLRDEQERSRRLAEVQLLDLGLEGELEAVRDSGGALPPEPAVPAPANGQKLGTAATGVLCRVLREI